VCTDTCARARDGTCDDGRAGAGQVRGRVRWGLCPPCRLQGC